MRLRGRGWGPLRSNGRVRWCFAKPDASLADAAAHLSIGRYFGMGGKIVYPLHGAHLFSSVIASDLKIY
jgi:hypothetical protein